MKNNLLLTLAAAGFVTVSALHAATLSEDFSHDPALDGWQVFGDTNLFKWDSNNHDLMVTWDSSKPNSYFYLPLGTILGRSNDFSMSFDLVLNDYAIGVNPMQPDTFQLATGLMNFQEATNAGFLRGSYPTQPDLAEFDFFQWDQETPYPATNSVNFTFVDSENDFAYNTYGVVELPTNQVIHVILNYTPLNQLGLVTTTTNAVPVVEPSYSDLSSQIYGSFVDMHLDTFAVESYSDVGSMASLLAHGTIANIVITIPPPPVGELQVAKSGADLQVQFSGQTGWNYFLQGSGNLKSWTPVGNGIPGAAGSIVLQDTNAPETNQFYRVQAQRQD